MRRTEFVNGEYYHIFNRGVDKRIVFLEQWDMERFLQSMSEFNTIDPIGSIYENSFRKDPLGNEVSKLHREKLVEFVCYCLNPNHYHFILRQLVDKGIEKFMHRLGVGYTKYFNHKYQRSGVLFQGVFKSIHINTNEYLLHLSAYVNLNHRVHSLGNEVSKSSWAEYTAVKPSADDNFCNKEIILSQFKNPDEYRSFAENSLVEIKNRKDMEKILLE